MLVWFGWIYNNGHVVTMSIVRPLVVFEKWATFKCFLPSYFPPSPTQIEINMWIRIFNDKKKLLEKNYTHDKTICISTYLKWSCNATLKSKLSPLSVKPIPIKACRPAIITKIFPSKYSAQMLWMNESTNESMYRQTAKWQKPYSLQCSLHISFASDKENLFNNQSFLGWLSFLYSQHLNK